MLSDRINKVSLRFLLEKVFSFSISHDQHITGISHNSRTTKPGDLFCAFPGEKFDGRDFIRQAISQGATAVLSASSNVSDDHAVPVYIFKNLKEKFGFLVSEFYGNPSDKLEVIGFTGTNGKTTCTFLLASALAYLQKKCLLMGTLGNGFLRSLDKTINTTSDAVTLQRYLQKSQILGAQYAALEVSSHALAQARVSGVNFSVAAFTNVSRDHLDYHKTLENYIQAKSRLFLDPVPSCAVLNLDSPEGMMWAKTLVDKTQVVGYSTSGETIAAQELKHVYVKKKYFSLTGIRADLITSWGRGELKSPLLGEFNLSNLLAVLSVLLSLKISLDDALEALSQVFAVPGRMEVYTSQGKPHVVLDYAHTPDALEKACLALLPLKRGHLICVFGCGGNRDVGKRSQMARLVEKYSDIVVVTDDNPRDESPEKIFQDIASGFKSGEKIIWEHDRAQAIAKAISLGKEGDVILIAGKGHELYQEVKGVQHPFSDRYEIEKNKLSSRARHPAT